jgi:hypothetical protein
VRLTPEQVDYVAGDSLYHRHLYFIHFCLGEPWWPESFQMALAFAHVPLPVEAMHRVAEGWEDDE